MQTKPGKAVSIIECDMQVEFAAPVGYQEPQRHPPKSEKEEEKPEPVHVDRGKMAFSSEGRRLDGKKIKSSAPSEPVPLGPVVVKRGIPNYDYKIGKITFKRNLNKANNSLKKDADSSEFEPFLGEGKNLRTKRKH